ncbi:Rieske 2Fe-2S family protein [Parvularcula bermudensis HTCC2503]|uniref:Rieske 2Fe-2S family protein n=1 Tax=Parvularcula bermudensis (strain ATCC BAA-594 / HTCC2503 / KCTC 12087) TaxID=314260 RepID=E0TI49_PARBH|nr:Rieske 2Fe-2S domain-containing protein [Parvularcula bermudensis]ADM09388.1 Rieske 2Fe-2S family protein [Parvularcula bermudensis HTCC2503]
MNQPPLSAPDATSADASALARARGRAPLTDIWYFAGLSSHFSAKQPQRMVLMGRPIVFARDPGGALFALADRCAHRAAPLSGGRIVDEDGTACLECPYHGWRFALSSGQCRKVPALSAEDPARADGIKVADYPIHEERGLVWIFIPAGRHSGDALPPPPALPPGVPGARPKMVITAQAEGPYDEAVIGLVDPAHTPFVHRQWFWRDPGEAAEKIKDYEPTAMGFRMKPHRPSRNGRAYRLIGGAATTEIEFRLPGLRFELIKNDRYTILGLTAITPLEHETAVITQMFFWDMPLLSLLKPLTLPLARRFLSQDGRILRLQNDNLQRQDVPMLYLGEPDRLAQWYLKLKRAYAEKDQGEAFINPLEPAVLRWRT